jgi:hypothetical protein
VFGWHTLVEVLVSGGSQRGVPKGLRRVADAVERRLERHIRPGRKAQPPRQPGACGHHVSGADWPRNQAGGTTSFMNNMGAARPSGTYASTQAARVATS